LYTIASATRLLQQESARIGIAAMYLGIDNPGF
jgi:hypothetical protein